MKITKTSCLLTGIVLLSFIYSSYGLSCYGCTKCNDVFNASEASIEQCTGRCAKTKLDNSGYVVRFCTPGTPGSDCKWTKCTSEDHNIGFCACDNDLCNSAKPFLEYQMNFLVNTCLSIALFTLYY